MNIYNIYDTKQKLVNTIVSDEIFVKEFCETNTYTYKFIGENISKPVPEPTLEKKYNSLSEKYELMAEVIDVLLIGE